MRESYLAGAYWGCRPESAEACARRAETFFRLMAECHPSYVRWYEQAKSTKQALQLQFEPTQDTFMRFFSKKKYQSGRDGFYFSAWTGHVKQEEGGMLMLFCGSAAKVAPNNLILHFPTEELGEERMLTASVTAGVMRALAVAWEPDWALVTGDDGLWKELSRHDEADTFVGWMTYISHRWGGADIPPLPEPVRVEPIGDQGSLITLTPERLTITRPDHVALGHGVQRLLEERGIFKPLIERRPPPVG